MYPKVPNYRIGACLEDSFSSTVFTEITHWPYDQYLTSVFDCIVLNETTFYGLNSVNVYHMVLLVEDCSTFLKSIIKTLKL